MEVFYTSPDKYLISSFQKLLQLSIAPYSDLGMVYVGNKKEIRMVKNKN